MCMSRNRGRDTKPEVALRKACFAVGMRYVLGANLPGRPDFVFPRHRLAVFVDGCFWHGCPTHHRDTKSNTKWWRDKIDNNTRRDAETTTHLQTAGWTVERVWEHEEPVAAAKRIFDLLEELRASNGPESAVV